MTEFIQLHILASYPPSNLNRDDLGRPKTAIMGGTQRLRISSQSLKRAWRQSELLQSALAGHIGIRTKEMGNKVAEALTSGRTLADVLNDSSAPPKRTPVPEKKAIEWARLITEQFGKLVKKEDSVKTEQIAHYSPTEIEGIDTLLEECISKGASPDKEQLSLLRKDHAAVDIAMFGRMFANTPSFNTEAAVQVSHAITVHDVVVEDDYFTAVDDLNRLETDAGSAHIGQFEFGSGLYYIYVCINRDLLLENLNGDAQMASKAIEALTEACAKVAPIGKQASFASRAYASYILAEKGPYQPRSLAVAFLKPLKTDDMLTSAISALEETQKKIDKVYGSCYQDSRLLNANTGEGTLSDILQFVSS
ncbi:MAG TPA: type I-E CRISPR-associated protein Cas7/Cse4/CasC [Syntrophales bacterium]|nr:type I-E CRISPR-associated protein Cas7/Cse4/CasC [Syntrophales bacterium]